MISRTSSILIVDDEPGLRVALRANFQRQGWRAETAAGLEETLAHLKQHSFDVVLCDVRLRDGDGFDVVDAVHAHVPQTSVLFLTAYGSVRDAVRAMRSGAADYLTKPVSFDHLLRTAERVISERLNDAQENGPRWHKETLVDPQCAFAGEQRSASAGLEQEVEILLEAEDSTGEEGSARLLDGSDMTCKWSTTSTARKLPPAQLQSMSEVERKHLERTLELVGGNRTHAAEILGVSVRTMRNKIRQYDLPPRRYA